MVAIRRFERRPQDRAADTALRRQKSLCGGLRLVADRLQIAEQRDRSQIKGDHLHTVLVTQGRNELFNRTARHRQLAILGHAPRDIQHEHIVAARRIPFQFLAGCHGEQEVTIFRVVLGSHHIDPGLWPLCRVDDHQVTIEVALLAFQTRLPVSVRVLNHGKVVAVRRTVHLDDRHGTLGFQRQRETIGHLWIGRWCGQRREWINIGRRVVIVFQFLRVSDLHALFGSRGDRKDPHLKAFVVHLLEQARVTFHLFVALVDLARSLLFDDFSDHFLAVDPHAEVGHRCTTRHRKGIKGFHDAVLGVHKHLFHFGNRHTVVDDHTYVMLFDRQDTAKSVVGDQQSSGVGGPRGQQSPDCHRSD